MSKKLLVNLSFFGDHGCGKSAIIESLLLKGKLLNKNSCLVVSKHDEIEFRFFEEEVVASFGLDKPFINADLLVYDASSQKSFDYCVDLMKKIKRSSFVLLIGNVYNGRCVTTLDAEIVAAENDVLFFEISNVDNKYNELMTLLVSHSKKFGSKAKQLYKLGSTSNQLVSSGTVDVKSDSKKSNSIDPVELASSAHTIIDGCQNKIIIESLKNDYNLENGVKGSDIVNAECIIISETFVDDISKKCNAKTNCDIAKSSNTVSNDNSSKVDQISDTITFSIISSVQDDKISKTVSADSLTDVAVENILPVLVDQVSNFDSTTILNQIPSVNIADCLEPELSDNLAVLESNKSHENNFDTTSSTFNPVSESVKEIAPKIILPSSNVFVDKISSSNSAPITLADLEDPHVESVSIDLFDNIGELTEIVEKKDCSSNVEKLPEKLVEEVDSVSIDIGTPDTPSKLSALVEFQGEINDHVSKPVFESLPKTPELNELHSALFMESDHAVEEIKESKCLNLGLSNLVAPNISTLPVISSRHSIDGAILPEFRLFNHINPVLRFVVNIGDGRSACIKVFDGDNAMTLAKMMFRHFCIDNNFLLKKLADNIFNRVEIYKMSARKIPLLKPSTSLNSSASATSLISVREKVKPAPKYVRPTRGCYNTKVLKSPVQNRIRPGTNNLPAPILYQAKRATFSNFENGKPNDPSSPLPLVRTRQTFNGSDTPASLKPSKIPLIRNRSTFSGYGLSLDNKAPTSQKDNFENMPVPKGKVVTNEIIIPNEGSVSSIPSPDISDSYNKFSMPSSPSSESGFQSPLFYHHSPRLLFQLDLTIAPGKVHQFNFTEDSTCALLSREFAKKYGVGVEVERNVETILDQKLQEYIADHKFA